MTTDLTEKVGLTTDSEGARIVVDLSSTGDQNDSPVLDGWTWENHTLGGFTVTNQGGDERLFTHYSTHGGYGSSPGIMGRTIHVGQLIPLI